MTFILFITACDPKPRIIDLNIMKPPDKVLYYVGEDTELDLTGGIVDCIFNSYNDSRRIMDDFFQYSHNIDFNTTGEYEVRIKKGKATCRFFIEVVEREAP